MHAGAHSESSVDSSVGALGSGSSSSPGNVYTCVSDTRLGTRCLHTCVCGLIVPWVSPPLHSYHGVCACHVCCIMRGEKGARGPGGGQGTQAAGREGDQRKVGESGRQGDTGEEGERGPEGPEGSRGFDGATGAAGITGPRGLQGRPGEPQGELVQLQAEWEAETTSV